MGIKWNIVWTVVAIVVVLGIIGVVFGRKA